jgi:ABC-type lipoprotein release transport system permease subunit
MARGGELPTMAIVWRSALRRGWRGLALTVVVVAVVGSVSLAALAGARRTSSSFRRFLEVSKAHDVLVFADDARPGDVRRLRSLPGVETIGYARGLVLLRGNGELLAAGAALDGSVFHDVDRVRIVRGRNTAPGTTDEVVVPEPLARRLRLTVGDTLHLLSYTPEEMDAIRRGQAVDTPGGPRLALRVVGVSRTPIDLSLQGAAGGVLVLSHAIVERYGADIANYSGPHGAVLMVRLVRGSAGVDTFLAQLRRVLGRGSFDVDPTALNNGGVQESIDVIAVAVLIFGLIAATAGVVATTLIAGRQVALTANAQRPLRDLGLDHRSRAVAASGPVIMAELVGGVIAVAGAYLGSGAFPFGVAGEAEPNPGLHFDALLLLGAVALVMLVGALTIAAGWRATRGADARLRQTQRWSFGRSIDAHAIGAPAAIGVGLALERGRGSNAIPVRSTLAGAAGAVVGIVALAVFGASLANLGHDPRAFGLDWDVRVNDSRARLSRSDRVCLPVHTRLARDPDIAALASECSQDVVLNGRSVGAYAITLIRGSLDATVLDGRAPRRPREIALGADTMRALDVHLGDHVVGRSRAGKKRFRVVGTVAVPMLSDPQALADGAVLTGRGLDQLDAPHDTNDELAILVKFRTGVDKKAAAARIRRLPGIGSFGQGNVARRPSRLEVVRLEQVNRIPLVLGAFLAVLGAIAVAHLLVTSVNNRRRDFAVLKAFGFTRGQVRSAVAWQATTVTAVGVTAGLALGLPTGVLLWRAAANRVGVLAEVTVPAFVLAAVVIGAFAIANAVALVPARRAGNTRAALTLRTE